MFTCVCLLDLIHGHSILEPWALNWPAGEDGIQSEGSSPLTCRSVVENVIVRVVARGCAAHIPSYELGCVVGLSYHRTQSAIKLKSVILSQCFSLTENYLFVAKSAGSYYSWFFRSVVSTGQLFLFRCLNTRNI